VLGSEPVDVLISDIAMPGEDGYTLMSKLRERERQGARHLVTIALTGHASDHDRTCALEAGFDWHMGRPVEAEAFVASVAWLLADRAVTAGR
jgi:CheY-like chemotaxis protein